MGVVCHSTQQELWFIDRLGSHRPKTEGNHVELLKKYKRALERRTVWGAMDKRAVLNYITYRIHKYRYSPSHGRGT